jgi:hypothetical protein
MNMAVIKARQNGFAFGVENAGLWAHEAGRLRIIADQDYAVATDGQGLDPGEFWIYCEYVGITDDKIGRSGVNADVVHGKQGGIGRAEVQGSLTL